MNFPQRLLLSAAFCSAISAVAAGTATAQTVDVIHWWTSGGESKAISVFAEEFKKRGGTWIDSAVVGGTAARQAAMNRIAGGDAPGAIQWNIGVAVTNLAKEGLLADLDDLAAAGKWQEKLPPLIVKNASYDGHFYADAQVNGATVHFLIDTGATGIALSTDDAKRAGLALDPNQAEVIGSGASGEVRGHWVKLDRVSLGLKSVSDTPAVVLAGGDRSLLGQSFLTQFGSVEIHDDTMVLR